MLYQRIAIESLFEGIAAFICTKCPYAILTHWTCCVQIVLVIFFFTVSRGLLTFLRDTWLRYIIPFDSYIRMHRHLAYHFFFWSWLHTIAHIINGIRATDPKNSGRWLPFGKSFNPPLLVQVTAAEYFALETQVNRPASIVEICACCCFYLNVAAFWQDE